MVHCSLYILTLKKVFPLVIIENAFSKGMYLLGINRTYRDLGESKNFDSEFELGLFRSSQNVCKVMKYILHVKLIVHNSLCKHIRY